MIEVETLTKRSGATRALDEVSLSAGAGRVARCDTAAGAAGECDAATDGRKG